MVTAHITYKLFTSILCVIFVLHPFAFAAIAVAEETGSEEETGAEHVDTVEENDAEHAESVDTDTSAGSAEEDEEEQSDAAEEGVNGSGEGTSSGEAGESGTEDAEPEEVDEGEQSEEEGTDDEAFAEIADDTEGSDGTDAGEASDADEPNNGEEAEGDALAGISLNQTPGIEQGTTTPLTELYTSGTSTAATTTAVAPSSGESGEEGSHATTTGPTIQTGTAIALANILNIVNTNLVNSSGYVYFANLFELFFGTLDFRSGGSLFGACGLFECSGAEGVSVNLSNDAYIENAAVIRASSGENTIEGGMSAAIETGDAYAGLNVVNVANTNIVDSNYVLVTLNAFQGINGDIVFPGLDAFLSSLAGGHAASVSINNVAQVENNIDSAADSGGNAIEGAGDIRTGTSSSTANVFNQLNTTLVGGGNVAILLRVHGDWVGEIFGAPEGLHWSKGADGSIYLFGNSTGGSGAAHSATTVAATSSALIKNNLSVVALTGDNLITGAETALISTGNALAGVNLVNIANGTVIGRNWLLAIINIFGDFNGNIAFGRPDLWVGAQAKTAERIEDGTDVVYTYTVINNGDSTATNVTLSDRYDSRYLHILEATVDYEKDGDGNLVWTIGTLPAGGAVEVSYTARIEGAGMGTSITNTITASSHEPDNNADDNTDTVTIRTAQPQRSGGGGGFIAPPPPAPLNQNLSAAPGPITGQLSDLSVARVRATSSATHGESVTTELVIRNTSAFSTEEVEVRDILRGPSGRVIRTEVWDLGAVLPHEEVRISYDIRFGESAAAGLYALSTELVKRNGDRRILGVNGHIELAALSVPPPPPAPAVAAMQSAGAALPGIPEVSGVVEENEATTTPAATRASSQAAAAASAGVTLLDALYFVLGAAAASLLLWILGSALTRREEEEEVV